MTTPGQKKTTPPPKPTTYEISRFTGTTEKPSLNSSSGMTPAWQVVGTITTTRGARFAVKEWGEGQGEKFAGGRYRAVPTSNITTVDVTIEVKRQLTLGAP